MSNINEPTAAQMEMLTPGSIWKRKNGAVSRFLFLTNDSIPAEHQDRFPQMAVFADDEDNVLSLPLEDFLANRKFHNVDGDLETRLINLLDDDEDGGDDQNDLDDGDNNDGDDSFDIDADEREQLAEVSTAVLGANATGLPFIKFTTENPLLPAMIDADTLARAVIGYVQTPVLSERRVAHTLTFAATDDVTAHALQNSFSPSRVEQNQVYGFEVEGPEGRLEIDWDEFIGVYPAVSAERGAFFNLVFYTKLNIAALEDTDAESAPDFVVQQDANGKNTISVAQADTDTFVIDNTTDRAVFALDTGDKPASAEQLAQLKAQFESAPIPAAQTQSGAGQALQSVQAPVQQQAPTTSLADDPAPTAKDSGFMIV